jgi:hypothetical protein
MVMEIFEMRKLYEDDGIFDGKAVMEWIRRLGAADG